MQRSVVWSVIENSYMYVHVNLFIRVFNYKTVLDSGQFKVDLKSVVFTIKNF